MKGDTMMFLVPKRVRTQRQLDAYLKDKPQTETQAEQPEPKTETLLGPSAPFSPAFLAVYDAWCAWKGGRQ